MTPPPPPEAHRNTVALIIPAYNPGPSLAPLLQTICPAWPKIWLVNDGSTDGSLPPEKTAGLRYLAFDENRGKGHALLAGIRAALEDPEITLLCTLDADGQHDPAAIPALLAAQQRQQADLVIGERNLHAGAVPWRSRLGNQGARLAVYARTRRYFLDTQCGFRLLSRPFAEAVYASLGGGRYETETAILLKALREHRPIASVPIETRYLAGNRGSHFRPVRDSLRVLRAVLAAQK